MGLVTEKAPLASKLLVESGNQLFNGNAMLVEPTTTYTPFGAPPVPLKTKSVPTATPPIMG